MKNVYISAITHPHVFNYMFLPYVAGALQSYCETIQEIKENYTWNKSLYKIEDIDVLLSKIHNPEVFGISCYVWNFRKQMIIAKKIKQLYPTCLIVAGGPHIPDDYINFFTEYPFIDILVHGEGEITFADILIENLKEFSDWSLITGITFQKDATEFNTGAGKKLPKDINYPSPYTIGIFDNILQEIKDDNQMPSALWETNRGCPYSCSFCDWGSATMSKIRLFDHNRLIEEMKWFGDNKIEYMQICDANFGILKRDIDLMKCLVETKKQTNYPTAVMTAYAKNSNDRIFEINVLSERANLSFGATLSVQSMDDVVLKNIDRSNIKTEKFMELIPRYNKEGISVYSEVIVGLPGETRESFSQSLGTLMKNGIRETIRIYPLVILPNAPLNSKRHRTMFKIKDIRRKMWGGGYGEDDIKNMAETINLGVGSYSMDTDDWIWCNVYSCIIQSFQSGGITRYITEHLDRTTNDFDFGKFYINLYEYFNNTDSVIGKSIEDVRSCYKWIIEDENSNYYGIKPKSFDEEIFSMLPHYRMWLECMLNQNKFYDEIKEFLVNNQYDVLNELLLWQKDIMIDMDYNSKKGKFRSYNYNFNSYFCGERLKEETTAVLYKDISIGPGKRSPLKWNNVREYLIAVTGAGSPYSKYFIHDIRKGLTCQ